MTSLNILQNMSDREPRVPCAHMCVIQFQIVTGCGIHACWPCSLTGEVRRNVDGTRLSVLQMIDDDNDDDENAANTEEGLAELVTAK